ncbi:MAG TPA: hypothetical protein VJC21_01300 [Candidatus Nanoarchaeia archaeon]|nr:hypothetical protein [Candidatus Nanoarchaeia archaeon]
MEALLFSLLPILGFFLLLLLVQAITKKQFCALCGAVFLTWALLLVLYFAGSFDNTVIIALLLGQSTLGVFYLAEKKVAEPLKLFRLPFLLTLIVLAYTMLTLSPVTRTLLLVLGSLWLIFVVLYVYRQNRKFKTLVEKIIACCRNW